MGFSQARKKKLRERGYSATDIKEMEKDLAETEDEEPVRKMKKSSSGGSGEVAILSGKAAEKFLAGLGGSSNGDDEDEDDEEDGDNEDDDDEDEAKASKDDEPGETHPWWKGR